MIALEDTTRSFLSTLHQAGAYGYWWTLEDKQSTWWQTSQPAAIPNGQRNVYFGVHPTATSATQFSRSQIDTIAAVNCLFAEFDAKDFGGDKAGALAHIRELEPAASVIIDSGGGYHCYWLLDRPWLLETADDRKRASKLQAAWVLLMGGDTQSKDLARVLRVPGTHNYKYSPPRDVQFVACNLDERWELETLAAMAQPFVESDRPAPAALPANDDDRLRMIAAQWLGSAVGRVRGAPDGQKHHTLLDAAITLGGFVPLGLLTEHEIERTLFAAIETRADDGKNAMQTIKDGIAYGIAKPWKTDDLLKGRAKPISTPQPDEHRITRSATTGEIIDVRPVGELPDVISAASLSVKVFDPLHWTVDGLLPEGACLLAAKPKAKKSWLALAVAVAVSMNGRALSYYSVSPGDVLYLDLESNQRRMQARLKNMITNTAWPENLHIATKWGRGDDCLSLIRAWVASKPNTRLIVIDILARVRPPRDPKADPYEQDYTFLQALNELAETLRITILIIHHTRKAKADDVFEEVSGTQAITGAVATIWMLSRNQDNAEEQLLHLRGRDLIDEEPIAIRWDSYTCQHVMVASGAEASSSAERRKILDVMDDETEYQLKEIAALVGKSMKAVDNHLRRLIDDNAVQRTGRGRYAKIPKMPDSRGIRGIRGIDGKHGISGIDQDDLFPDSTGNSTIPRHSTTGDVEFDTASGRGETPINGQFHEFHGKREESQSGDEADFWASVPSTRRIVLRLYLRSQQDKDQVRARELCEEYGLDYETAKQKASEG
jgi:AAA domain/RepB DNA-primase from phage plasmid